MQSYLYLSEQAFHWETQYQQRSRTMFATVEGSDVPGGEGGEREGVSVGHGGLDLKMSSRAALHGRRDRRIKQVTWRPGC